MNRDTNATRMLIVEDDPEMGMGLEDFFELKGYAVTRAAASRHRECRKPQKVALKLAVPVGNTD